MTKIPDSLIEEHNEIFSELRRFAKLGDRTGEAIRHLLRALEPHFEKEDELAMPLLGALAPLSSEELPVRALGEGNIDEILFLQSKLVRELHSMLAEHKAILGLIASARKEASRERHGEVVDSLGALEHHAKVEEEVLYPAAILTGVVARALRREIRA